jgi:sugar phosphate isomerase/epimerase
MVIMHVPHSESLDTGKGLEYRETIEAWQPRLSVNGLRLAMENKALRHEGERRYALAPLSQLRSFADRYDLDLVLDTVHAATAGENLVQAWQTFDGRLANLHLSDMGGQVPWAIVPHFRWMLEHHRFPGSGDLPLGDLLGQMASADYDGLVTLEVNPAAVHIWWPPAVRRHLARAMAWMREATGLVDGE